MEERDYVAGGATQWSIIWVKVRCWVIEAESQIVDLQMSLCNLHIQEALPKISLTIPGNVDMINLHLLGYGLAYLHSTYHLQRSLLFLVAPHLMTFG